MTPLPSFGLLSGVLLALGVRASGHLPQAGPWLAAAASLALVLLVLPCMRRYAALRPLRAMAAMIGGFVLVWWQVHRYEQLLLAEAFDERVLVSATIEGLPLRRGADLYFSAQLASLTPAAQFPGRLRAALRWSGAPELRAGDRWQLLAALHAPAHAANPGSVDAETLNLRVRLHASGQIVDSPLNRRLPGGQRTLDYWRGRIALAIARRISERDSAALVIALAIGDTQRISAEQWRVFNANGITHLVAISGLHVTLFCLLTSAAMAALWRRMPWLQARIARATCAALFGLCASGGYALLSGWSVPAQRTLMMLVAWHGLHMLARPRRASVTLAAGLTGVLCLDPLAPLAAGFWLSFLAVAALLLGGAVAGRALRGWRALLHEQALVAVALLPVTVAVFGSMSVAGLIVNLAAIPFFSVLLVPLVLAATLCLACCAPLASALLKLCAWLLAMAWPVFQAVADWPAALWHADPAHWWYLLAVPALLLALLPWPAWMRASAVLALLPAWAPLRAGVPPGQFCATVFDVGAGEATLLRTATHALLFDVGETWGSGGQVSAQRLLPALRYYRVAVIDRLILPHVDGDRGAGAAALSAGLQVRDFYAGGAAGADGNGTQPAEFKRCTPGLRWQWDGVDFQLLDGPSCALRVASGGAALLLPGSANGATQTARLAPALAPTAVVLVPGHGSRSAWSAALASAASAQLAILSAGPRARQRATVAATMAAWRAAGAQLRETGRDGALELQFQPSGRIDIAQWRKP